jgi:hypothetical protein
MSEDPRNRTEEGNEGGGTAGSGPGLATSHLTNHAWADAHHVVHWSDGGPTSLDNLALLCRTHHRTIHRTIHEGQWQLTRGPGGRWTARRPPRAGPAPPPAACVTVTPTLIAEAEQGRRSR